MSQQFRFNNETAINNRLKSSKIGCPAVPMMTNCLIIPSVHQNKPTNRLAGGLLIEMNNAASSK
ncbi:hypothetical protein [Snodgrassella communis]|uniref:hypothetical protein n=1 Tax=Snodgrassella communis TaxID=2946699 RepID=UPI001EF5DA76|nr:hypothetical protein [Snodgrassella communis]